MPKVSSVFFKIKGESKEYAIHYLKQDKFYIKDFPDDVFRLVNSVTSDFTRSGEKFETEQELTDYYEKFIERYHNIISQTRKVIAYHISAPSMFRELPEVNQVKQKLGYAGGQGENVFGFTIDYGVFLQQEGNGTSFFTINTDGSAGSFAHFEFKKSIIIDHTPEREVFLENMKQRMREMFLKVISVMMDEDKFTTMIDSGMKLLA